MNSIINHILLPMPHMQDPYFNRSVVFMCEHNKDGAMGLIVNKPFSAPALKALFDSFYDDTSTGTSTPYLETLNICQSVPLNVLWRRSLMAFDGHNLYARTNSDELH